MIKKRKVARKNVERLVRDIKPIRKDEAVLVGWDEMSNKRRLMINTVARREEIVAQPSQEKVSSDTSPIRNEVNWSSDNWNEWQGGSKKINEPIKRGSKKITRFTALVLLVLGVWYGMSLWQLKNESVASLFLIKDKINGIESGEEVAWVDMENMIKDIRGEVSKLRSRVNGLGLAYVAEVISPWWGDLKSMTVTLYGAEEALAAAEEANATIKEVKEKGINYFLNGEGEKWLGLLRSLDNNLKIINGVGQDLAALGEVGEFNFGKYTEERAKLYAAEEDLKNLLKWLEVKGDRHVAILLQNASEIRPTGGFIGSLLDVTLRGGAIQEITTTDIYDPDGWVNEKVVPPEALQIITEEWEARDANWLFDFHDSAEAVVNFLNGSDYYRDRGVVFDGVVAINTDVFDSVLNMIGPIELSDYDMTITTDNWLESLQYEVEVERTKDDGRPKTILEDLTPLVTAKIKKLNEVQKETLQTLLLQHIVQKDIMAYAGVSDLQKTLERRNLAGRVYETLPGSEVNYLAVVAANIAGGKTDAFTEQGIELTTEISGEGVVRNYLTVEREHKGEQEKYSWYTTKNQIYLRVLAPLGSKLTDLVGEDKKLVSQPKDYEAEGYKENEKIKKIEKEGEESGKEVWPVWLITRAGQSRDIKMEYEMPRKLWLYDGQTYEFVFDKQSGVKGPVKFTIESPPGYKWKESNNFTFVYENDDPPGRVKITLTMQEIR